jgi:hypothetical protein
MTFLSLIETDTDLAEAALEAELDLELETLLLDARAQRAALLTEEAA